MRLLRCKKRILAFLLAVLFVLSGVLSVAAESVVEYSRQEVSLAELLAVDSNGATVHCYVWVDGKRILLSTVSGYYSVDGRSYVTLEQMTEVYGEYGFTEAKAQAYKPSQKLFPHSSTSEETIWADALNDNANKVGGADSSEPYVVPVGTGASGAVYNLYYTPAFPGGTTANIGNSSFINANTFCTVNITDPDQILPPELDGQTGSGCIFAGDTVTVQNGDDVSWICTDTNGNVISGTVDEERNTTAFTLTYDGTASVSPFEIRAQSEKQILTLSVNGEERSWRVQKGTVLQEWLREHAEEAVGTAETHPSIGSYSWKIEGSDTEIGTSAELSSNLTLIGTPKEIKRITFAAVKPGTQDEELLGGEFIHPDADYITVQVYQGDTIPAEFLSKMRANLQVKDKYTFTGWYYDAAEAGTGGGELPVTEATEIVTDLTVYAKYKTKATYTFYTDRSMQEIHATASDLPVGEPYPYQIPAITVPEGKTFRYWVNATDNKVFTLQDTVVGDAELYPVFERYIFELIREGKVLISLYDGNKLQYAGEEKSGYYFAGFDVSKAEGSDETVFVPNGTVISPAELSALGITVPQAENGVYQLEAVPVYRKQHTLIYHGGSDGQLILTDQENDNTYTEVVDDSITLLGAMDITNTASPIGLALAGWALSEEEAAAGTIAYQPYETLSESELDKIANEGNNCTAHLWPVWTQQDDTIKVTFVSNYPSGAEYEGQELAEDTYTIYIRSGMKPTVPKLERVDMVEPDNVLEDTGEQRYVLAGWSTVSSGIGYDDGTSLDNNNVVQNGVYSVNSEYALAVSEDTVFYGIWIDREKHDTLYNATFFIRGDGILPTEPGTHAQADYYPKSIHKSLQTTGALKGKLNVVNDPEKVEANIHHMPDINQILTILKNENYSDAHFEMMTEGLTWDGTSYTGSCTSYGRDKSWWIEWYACKPVACCGYHVDGRIRFADQVELNYHGNGGSYVPAGKVYSTGSNVTVEYRQTNGTKPQLDNFTFIGWSEDPDALVPTYYDPEYAQIPQGALTEIQMDTDKDLYAVWDPNPTTIPLEGPFSGIKYVEEEERTAEATNEGEFRFEMTLIEKPDKAEEWKVAASNSSDGSFSFGQISVKHPGIYVFEVKEIPGDDDTIQYDASVYHLTVNIVLSDYGLGIGGYSFTKSGKPVLVTGTSVGDAVFRFTNKVGIRDVQVIKEWEDGNNADGLRPDEIAVWLLQNGHAVVGAAGDEVQILNAANDWKYIWTDIPSADHNGVAYIYTVEEAGTYPGYETVTEGDMSSGFTITNIHEPLTWDIPVEKIWEDQEDLYGARPDTVDMTLTGYKTSAEGGKGEICYQKTLQLTKAEDQTWRAVFENIPAYADGIPLQYELTEKEDSHYSSAVTRTENWDGSWSYTVTNTLKTTDVSVTKLVSGNMGDRRKEFGFTAKLLDKAGNVISEYELPDDAQGYTKNADGTLSFALLHEQSVILKAIPMGAQLQILESDAEGYKVSWETDGVTVKGTACQGIVKEGQQITCTNYKDTAMDIGVHMDRMPYLTALVIVLIGLFMAGLRGRRRMRIE